MKITQAELKRMIKEELEQFIVEPTDQHIHHSGCGCEGYGEGSMARNQLGRTAELAAMIQNLIEDETDLEEWVESKITLAEDYLTTVLDYLRGEELSEEQMSAKEKQFAALAPPKDEITYADTIAGARKGETDEAKMTKPQMKKREKIVKGMKSSAMDFEKRYPGRGEEVMYATATKQAMKKK